MRVDEAKISLATMEREIETLRRKIAQAELARNYVRWSQLKTQLQEAEKLYETYKRESCKRVTELIPDYKERCKLSDQILLLMTVADLFVDVYNDTHDVMKQALSDEWDVVVLNDLLPAVEPIRKSIGILGGFGDALAEHFSAMTDVVTPQIKAYISKKIKPYRSGKVKK